MHTGNLLAFSYEDFEDFDNAIGELLLRKVLHKSGYNQRDLILDLGDGSYSSLDIIFGGMDAARKVFAILGYTLGMPDERQLDRAFEDYNQYFYIDLELPELNGWRAHQLNPYRERWKDYFQETRHNKPDYEVRLRTIRSRQSVLRFRFDIDSANQFFFQLPTLVENFLHWRMEMLEVIGCDSIKCQNN